MSEETPVMFYDTTSSDAYDRLYWRQDFAGEPRPGVEIASVKKENTHILRRLAHAAHRAREIFLIEDQRRTGRGEETMSEPRVIELPPETENVELTPYKLTCDGWVRIYEEGFQPECDIKPGDKIIIRVKEKPKPPHLRVMNQDGWMQVEEQYEPRKWATIYEYKSMSFCAKLLRQMLQLAAEKGIIELEVEGDE